MHPNKLPFYLIRFSLVLLLFGLLGGLLGAFAFLGEFSVAKYIPFHKLRPLHVSAAIFWILSAATGGVLFYVQELAGKPLFSPKIAKLQLVIWVGTIIAILVSFILGKFSGREYWEYPPLLSLPLLVSWVLFGYNFFMSLPKKLGDVPVYVWMWSTGVVFFIITFLENNLWVFPWFRDNIIRDITVQWKSNGAIVGSWNMLIYGSSIYLMEKISGSKETARQPISFFFYFLGLTNLMFNWGHHTYLLPAQPWIRHVSYAISMTEWVIFISIIQSWKKTVTTAKKHYHITPYRFLIASEVWVFLNLSLALLMSIPAINLYTHGTHITVAHAMGTTIGINSMILFASLFYIFSKNNHQWVEEKQKQINTGYWLVNVFFVVFWLGLVGAGAVKGYYTMHLKEQNFHLVMAKVNPYLYLFAFAGIGLLAGFFVLIYILLRSKSPQIAAASKNISIPTAKSVKEPVIIS